MYTQYYDPDKTDHISNKYYKFLVGPKNGLKCKKLKYFF